MKFVLLSKLFISGQKVDSGSSSVPRIALFSASYLAESEGKVFGALRKTKIVGKQRMVTRQAIESMYFSVCSLPRAQFSSFLSESSAKNGPSTKPTRDPPP